MRLLIKKESRELMTYKGMNDNEVLYLIEDNEECLGFFLDKYRPIILAICNKYYKAVKDFSYGYEDLVQEGNLGLVNAINHYNSNKNILFYTFACVCIERSIYMFVSKRIKSNKNIVSLDNIQDNYPILYNLVICGNNYVENSFYEKNFFNYIVDFKNALNFNESCVFELRCNGFSYKEISSLLELSTKYVDNTLQKCRKKFIC